MFRRLTTHFFIIASRLFITCGLILAVAPKAEAQEAGDTFEAHVGHGKVNIVDFRRSPNSGGLPLVFRIEYKTFKSVPSDGFFGRITRGKMTFSLPRQNNPEMAYDKTASIAARLTQGPAFGDTVDYQARELAPNVFEVHWKEPRGETRSPMSRISIGRSFARILPASTACQSRRRSILWIWTTGWITQSCSRTVVPWPKAISRSSPCAGR